MIVIVLFGAILFFMMDYIHTMNRHNNDVLRNSTTNVYLINLDRNKERLKYFDAQYKHSDLRSIPYQRFEAVDGRKLHIRELTSEKAYQEIIAAERNGFRTKHYQLTRGAIGCYLSHMELYKKIAADRKPYALIFEDDVRFPKHVLSQIHGALERIPNDWDIFLLGCFCIVCNKTQHFSQINRFFFLHAYLITRQGAEKIVNYLANVPIEQQIDSVLSRMAEKGMLHIYCANQHIVQQNNRFNTTIQLPIKRVLGVNPYAKE